MSELLTHEEYTAIAAGLTLPTTAFVDGSFRASQSSKTFETVNPANATFRTEPRCQYHRVDRQQEDR
ncbi:MAG: hypothetical protein AAF220_05600, partial [Pseudomonadota bacterium]